MRKGRRAPRLVVTRVFDGQRTPQEAFVRVILNAEEAETENEGLNTFREKNIIEGELNSGDFLPREGEVYG